MSYAGSLPPNSSSQMQRITITLDDALLTDLDALIGAHGYRSRSEAIRDVLRAGVREALLDGGKVTQCVAVLVYAYDHAVRDLALLLAGLLHDQHDLVVSTTERQLNHESALAVVLMQGLTQRVCALADLILIERGVRHGRLMIVPLADRVDVHNHAGGLPHAHVRV